MPPPPPSPDANANGEERESAPAKRLPPPWRLGFDLIERPIGAASESFIQTDVFMDALAGSWKLQRRMTREVERGVSAWLGLFGVPRRGDVNRLVNQVAGLERQVRQLRRELEQRNGTEVSEQRPAATTRRSSAKGKGR